MSLAIRVLIVDDHTIVRKGIRALLAEREPAYRQADVFIHSALRPPHEVAQQIAHQFHIARAK